LSPPIWPARRVLELAPLNWEKTLEKTDAEQRLDARVLRRATLAIDDQRPSR